MNKKSEQVSAFVKSLTNNMLKFCGPIFIAPGTNSYPSEMIDSGTYSLIDTGQKRLLVTCYHVWKEYLDCREKNPKVILALNLGNGPASIAFKWPERQLVSTDPDLDLAIFDLDPNQITENKSPIAHEKDCFPIRQWPIPPAKTGDLCCLMGFSGKQIKKEGKNITFRTCVLPFRISGAGQKAIWILNEDVNKEVFSYAKNRLGGLSGSPAYTLDKNGDVASLIGFVQSGYKSEAQSTITNNSIFAGTLILTPSTFLKPDGRLTTF